MAVIQHLISLCCGLISNASLALNRVNYQASSKILLLGARRGHAGAAANYIIRRNSVRMHVVDVSGKRKRRKEKEMRQ